MVVLCLNRCDDYTHEGMHRTGIDAAGRQGMCGVASNRLPLGVYKRMSMGPQKGDRELRF